MPLAEDQRAWLDMALRNKGRFTRAATIRKEFESYRRRREKAAIAWEGIPANHPDYATIQNGLTAADQAAQNGQFSDAYKQLSTIKSLAKAAVTGHADGLHDANLRMSLKTLESHVNATTEQVDGCYRRDASIKQRIQNLPQASSADNFEGAMGILKQINELTPALRGDVADLIGAFRTAVNDLRARNIDATITRLQTDLAALRATGRGNIADKYSGGVETLARIYRSEGGRYTDATALYQHSEGLSLELERGLSVARNLGDLKPDPQAPSVRPDDKTDKIRSGLSALPEEVRAQMQLAEQKRIDERVQEYFRQRNSDSFHLLDTSVGLETLAPMPEKYNFDAVFVALTPENTPIPDEVPDELRDQLTTAVVQRITTGMTGEDANDDVLLNMSVRSFEDFATMAREQLFQGKKRNQLSDSQWGLVKHMAVAMEREVCLRAPNKMADDASEITVGGVRYEMIKELKSGANGTARLFRDPNPPNATVVVKTIIDQTQRHDLAYEIETHYRASKASSGEDSAIVGFKGAARSDNGGIHLVIEAVDGGDLEDMTGGLGAMESLGLLPPEAKRAIAIENLRKVVEAMKDLEAQGLVNHDLKPENVMFTSDGKVKIIDYGEADFVKEDGIARTDRALADTRGYAPPESGSKSFTQKFDTYALAGFLQKMVGGKTPESGEINMKPTSALSRLIEKLRDPDPEKRPSLDAILATTIMTSAQDDHGPEAMENLNAASTEFAGLISGLSSEIDLQTLVDRIGGTYAGFFRGKPPSLSKAQLVMAFIDDDISLEIDRCTQGGDYALDQGPKKINELKEKKKFLQTQIIDKLVTDQLEKGETEFGEAMKRTDKCVGFQHGDAYREVTPNEAKQLIERLQSNIETQRGQAFRLIERDDLTEEQISEQLDPLNQKLAEQAILLERIEAALKSVLGAAAKLFLAKKRLNEATVNFRGGKRALDEVDDPEAPHTKDPRDKSSTWEKVGEVFDTALNKHELSEEIDEKVST
ncbi:protein kinase family protein [Arenibacterium sp. LLYu02]|uniref:protein kinase family protein n=1 Tax=Arenibacterium sp. LLYu02 TaxID=3404132 RepID=UPI003B21CEA0